MREPLIGRIALAPLVALSLLGTTRAEEPPPAPPTTVVESPAAGPSAAAPATEAAYRAAVERSYAIWKERPDLGRNEEASCIKAWQEGDRARTILDEVTPPPPEYAAYDAAVRECMTASLATWDECLVQPGGGPKWRQYVREARKLCLAVAPVVARDKVDLPFRW